MAKIVTIIHTHCLDNGFFVWTGDSPETYHACSLLEILRDCSPKGIFKYLSDAEGTLSHNHKSLILNLTCSHMKQAACHCADAVLSLANNTTVVSKVSARLLDLVAYWVQTLSDYNVLMAKAMTCDWAKEHMPVLSRQGNDPTCHTTYTSGNPPAPVPITPAPSQDDHILYTKFSLGQPKGMTVLCHLRCTIAKFSTDMATPLGRQVLVAVKYPLEQFPTQWELPKPGPFNVTTATVATHEATTPPAILPPRHRLAAHPPPPDMMAWLTSLPSTTATTPTVTPAITPKPLSSLRIWIPRMASTPSLFLAGASGEGGTHSTTATPPPPSPQEPPKPRKRTLSKLKTEMMQKRKRYSKHMGHMIEHSLAASPLSLSMEGQESEPFKFRQHHSNTFNSNGQGPAIGNQRHLQHSLALVGMGSGMCPPDRSSLTFDHIFSYLKVNFRKVARPALSPTLNCPTDEIHDALEVPWSVNLAVSPRWTHWL
ncbi:hypothetical protein BDM02DRAFT_3132771 [Thelephora ganbajun]|uniref:Uncharacterized protein n=1 Tax=Thelephora ganbajun TaxID=370292 RepID=A0ACB6Z054_THEGA|nr:hypothetical protein BDM02DRAFT_3132771 [Thelephora ganbajun]